MILEVVAGMADHENGVVAVLDVERVGAEMEMGRIVNKFMLYKMYTVSNVMEAA